MGSLVPLIVPAVAGFAAGKILTKATAPPKPVQAPQAAKALAPPTTADTTQAQDQARRRTPTGRADTFITGDLVPQNKKKTLLG